MITDRTIENLASKFEGKFKVVVFLDYLGVFWNNEVEMVEHSHEVEKYLRGVGYEGKIEDVYSGQHFLKIVEF